MLDGPELEQRLIARLSQGRDLSGIALIAPEVYPRAGPGHPVLTGWWSQPDPDGATHRLENPWDDATAVAAMSAVCDEVTVDVLDGLASVMREIHGVSYETPYWEALLGPLLGITVAQIADHRIFLGAAAAAAPSAQLLSSDRTLEPSASVWEAINVQLTEAWNLAMLYALAPEAGIELHGRAEAPFAPASLAPLRPPTVVRLLRRGVHMGHNAPLVLARRLARRPRGEREVVVLGNVNLDARQTWALHRAVPGVALAPTRHFGAGEGPLHASRPALADLPAKSALARAVTGLLPLILPRSVLEDYPRLAEESQRLYGAPAHAVHGNWAFGDLDSEFLGRSRSAGRNVAFAQHGGATYQLAVAPHEWHERRVGTAQLSWGRTGGAEQLVSSPHVARLSRTHRGGRRVLVVEGLCPPLTWIHRLTSTPIGDQWFDEEARLVQFVQALGQTRDHLELRRYPGIRFDGARHPVVASLPTPPAGLLPQTATDLMKTSRVTVLAYPDTPLLEAMAVGTPVIGVWNPRWWPMRDDAQELFARLATAGVVHEDPQAAAAHLDAIYDHPEEWWDSDELRALRRDFCTRFARDGPWLEEWRSTLTAPERGLRTSPSRAR